MHVIPPNGFPNVPSFADLDAIAKQIENQIYSDTPVLIGLFENKSVYRKMVTLETPIVSNDSAYTSTGIDSSNIGLIFRGDGINADGTYYGHLTFDPTYSDHTYIGVKGTGTVKYIIIEYTEREV